MKIRSAAAPVLLAVLLAACHGRGGDVVIGIAGPLEKANGHSMKLAAQMAADEINQHGGIDGRHVRLVFGDDEGDQSKAIEVARQLRGNAEVLAVVGHVNSAASLKAATMYNAENNDSVPGDPVVQISPASSSPELTQAGDWTFRVCPTDLEFSPALARWAAANLGRRRAAVLYANDNYGQGVASTFTAAFSRDGGTVVEADPYLPEVYDSPATLDPYLQRAMRRGADALVIGGQAAEGLKIIAAARRLGFTGPILGADGLTSVKDSAIAEGVYVSSAFLPDRPTEKAQAFVRDYRTRFHELPDHRGAMTYDVIYLLKDAIEHGGASRAAIRDYVAGVGTRTSPFEGVSGEIKFDRNGDVVGKPVTVGIVHNRQLVTAR
jgi:branched-chain amino acid transport system substrate-binding protein